ncbi:MAG: hypothetical protein H6905_05880 [Hyphomicrobiales bacterium]|nr:hypothetical protein [Hyphomicrobiales bacterium]
MDWRGLFGGDPHGALLFIALVSLPISVVLSLCLLALYRRAVERTMHAPTESGEALEPAPADFGPDLSVLAKLTLDVLDPSTVAAATPSVDPGLRVAKGLARRAAAVYAVAGAAHAAIAVVILFVTWGTAFLPVRTFFVWFVLAWPIVPTVMMVAVSNRRARIFGVAMYFLIAIVVSPVSLPDLAQLWGWLMGIPTALMLAVSLRPLRAVGPLVLTAVVVVLTGINVSLSVFAGWSAVPGLLVLAGFAWVTWKLFHQFTERYRRKRTSDQALLLDSWWLLVTLWECLYLSADAGIAGLLMLAAFAAYTVIVHFGFRSVLPIGDERHGRSLLLLRVFGYRRRSERLLDDLGHTWRYAGPVNLIAAQDLAAGYVEPHAFLAFLSGRLKSLFVKGQQDLDRRIEDLDTGRDPDSRFRVNAFYCHADTWQNTMLHLVASSHAILMDLRGFAANNQGCVYELQQVLNMVSVRRIILIIDATTDRTVLEDVLQQAWRRMPATSPNAVSADGRLKLFSADTRQNNEPLLRLLFSTDPN